MITTLLLIQRQSFQLFISDRATPIAVMVPETLLRDMEVVNEGELGMFLKKVFPAVDAHAQAQITIVISEELCFVAPFNPEKIDETQAKLQNESPFAQVALATIKNSATPVVISTNQELYEAIGRVLEANHYAVASVYPWRALQLGEMAKSNAIFDIAASKRICESPAVYKNAAFPYKTTLPVIIPSPIAQASAQKAKFPVGWIIFGVISFLYVCVMLFIMFRQ